MLAAGSKKAGQLVKLAWWSTKRWLTEVWLFGATVADGAPGAGTVVVGHLVV
jgi:hypothetical protein